MTSVFRHQPQCLQQKNKHKHIYMYVYIYILYNHILALKYKQFTESLVAHHHHTSISISISSSSSSISIFSPFSIFLHTWVVLGSMALGKGIPITLNNNFQDADSGNPQKMKLRELSPLTNKREGEKKTHLTKKIHSTF